MKKLMILSVLFFIFLASCQKTKEKNTETTVSVSMEANSPNDVYYSFSNGVVQSVPRSDWDIEVSVPLHTATIRINEGAGVELYSAGDTNAWDTANLQNKVPVFNNNSDWSIGAFNFYSTGGINFGWGTYDQSVHSVFSDSIYIIKLSNGSYKKLFIKNRIGNPDTYVLRWANIDGSDPVDTTFSASVYYNKKNFIQYSIINKKVVEAEPDMNSWDLLFTRYIIKIPAGPGIILNYPVTGVLINPNETGVKVTGVNPEIANYTDTTAIFTSQADVIGWDWKVNDPVSHQYSIAPNTSYFIKRNNGAIYRIYFKNYISMSDGSIIFNTKLIE